MDSALATIAVAGLFAWLPLQTPLAVALYQYAGLSEGMARGLLLIKDAAVAGAVLILFVRNWRALHPRWFDACAVAYAAAVGVYTIIPLVGGSSLPAQAIIASAREFLVPVELYALGRLAVAAGAKPATLVHTFLVISALAAVFTLATYLLLPVTFWATTLDLVSFIREVQGIPQAVSLYYISAVGSYGVDGGALFARAIGPFAHPVGTSHYYVAPLLLSMAAVYSNLNAGDLRRAAVYAAAALLFAAAVIAPISRAAWIAAGLAVLLVGIRFRRVRYSLIAVAATVAFVAAVPPFSHSIWSALSLQDSSTIGHQQEVQKGIETVLNNPAGLGAGQADYFGKWLGSAEGGGSAGVGENMYLATWVTAGPVGLAALVLWLVGLIRSLLGGSRHPELGWMAMAIGAALVGFAVSAMTASPLMRFTTAASFWLLTGILAVAIHPPRPAGSGLTERVRDPGGDM